MRTIKALACAAALVAGLATTAVAQNVYSLNVVGYYNVTVPQNGLFMIANQLNTTNNTIGSLLANVPDFTQLFKYSGGSYSADQFVAGWGNPNTTLNPGETAVLQDGNNTPGGMVVTFVGEVLQGALANTLTLGDGTHNLCYRSSLVPQEGTPVAFGIPAEDFDQIYVYNGAFTSDQFVAGWGLNGGNGPTIKVGQGFGYLKAAGNVSSSWVRNFTVQ